MLCSQNEDQRPIPELGQIVAVRQRLYLVEQSVSPVNPGDSTLVQLSCVDDDAQGQPLEVLWKRELDGQVITGEAWESIASRGFRPSAAFCRLPKHAPLELRCQCPAMVNGRCRLHGGLGTGPKTAEGIERIRRAVTRHGRYSAEAKAARRYITSCSPRAALS